MCSSPHWQVGQSWFSEKLSPANREQRLSRWADFAKNCLPRIGSKVLPRFRKKYRALRRQKNGVQYATAIYPIPRYTRPRYIGLTLYWLVWPWWRGRMYWIVTGVTSDVGVPSTYLVYQYLYHVTERTNMPWPHLKWKHFWANLPTCLSAYIMQSGAGIILGMASAIERRHFYVTPTLIGQAHTQSDPCGAMIL